MTRRCLISKIMIVVTAFCISATAQCEEQPGDESAALRLFHTRIMPIFRSPNPSSCVQCHLASVELKDYILPSHEQTFISLRDQGLINLDAPQESKILELIRMGEKDADKGARLIHETTRKAEYDAFAAWIEACCQDPDLRRKPALAGFVPARPEKSDPVIRHARKSRVVDSFVRNVWSQRMRCFPCHTPHEIDPENPQHKKSAERYAELLKQYGQRVHIFRETPEATLEHLIVGSRKATRTHLPLLNLQDPKMSLLILKPTSKLPMKKEDGSFERPSSIVPVSHMGGLKMHVDDQSYKSFIAWIQDYANVVGDRYKSVADLPADNWAPTMRVLRLKDCPDNWQVGTTVQLFVHRWNERDDDWDGDAIAFTQGTVTPRAIVNGALFVLAPDTVDQPKSDQGLLTPGKYRVNVYVDQQARISEDPALLLGKEDLKGHVEIDAQWREGFPQAEVISFQASTTN